MNRKLDSGLTRRLILVSAPPGFGKTTLVAEWLADSHQSYAWLSLDEGDNDPTRFLAYLLAALDQAQPGIGQEIQPLLASPQPPPFDMLIAGLINDLAILQGALVLVLDDYHFIHNEEIHRVLQVFIERLPPSLHLVLIGRQDPPLSLPRLRARDEILEIREADLRLSLQETSAFMERSFPQALSSQALASLHRRTEGWIAGLQMAALAIQSPSIKPEDFDAETFIASFHGDDRFIMDYLVEEVFNRQPPQVQDFLLQTSILDKICGPLCDALLENRETRVDNRPQLSTLDSRFSSSQTILEYLDRANLFTLPLDNRREWYRYHHLFADLLRFRLQRQSAEKVPELHRLASRWFSSSGLSDEAMRHALAVPDPVLAAGLAEQYMLHLVGSSQVATYLGWVQRLPDELIFRRAYLCAGCGWAYAITCQTDTARKYAEAGEAALTSYEPVKSAPEMRLISREEVRGHLRAIHAYTDRLLGDYPAAILHSGQALESLPSEARTVRGVVAFNLGLLQMEMGDLAAARKSFEQAIEATRDSRENLFVAVSARSLLGGIAAQQGKLREAEGDYHDAIQLGTLGSGKPVPIPAVAYAHGGLVALHYQRDELGEAEANLEKALPLVQWIGQPETFIIGTIYRSLLAQARGDFKLAEEWLHKAGELFKAYPLTREGLQIEYEVAWGQFLLAQRDIAAAAHRLEARGIEAGRLGDSPDRRGLRVDQLNLQGSRLSEYLLLARILLAQGAGEQAGALLVKISAQSDGGQNVAVLLEALALQAVAAYRRPGDLPRAIAYLERALNLASAEKFARPFLNAGEALVKLLRQAILQDIQPGFAHDLLVALESQARSRAGEQQPDKGPTFGREGRGILPASLVEPLTSRERQVLRLLAAGLSSAEIAEELVLSVGTVRSYMKSLYSKLGAHSREEAVEIGRSSGNI